MCVVYLYVVAVLEYIFGVAFQAVYKDVLREHERVGAIVQLNVFQFQTVYLISRKNFGPSMVQSFITILSEYQMAERLSGAK